VQAESIDAGANSIVLPPKTDGAALQIDVPSEYAFLDGYLLKFEGLDLPLQPMKLMCDELLELARSSQADKVEAMTAKIKDWQTKKVAKLTLFHEDSKTEALKCVLRHLLPPHFEVGCSNLLDSRSYSPFKNSRLDLFIYNTESTTAAVLIDAEQEVDENDHCSLAGVAFEMKTKQYNYN